METQGPSMAQSSKLCPKPIMGLKSKKAQHVGPKSNTKVLWPNRPKHWKPKHWPITKNVMSKPHILKKSLTKVLTYAWVHIYYTIDPTI